MIFWRRNWLLYVCYDDRKKEFVFFPGKNSTYALVYDRSDEGYYMGISSTDKISAYSSRISRPFYQYHKFQNAYYNTIMNLEK
ncbi:hypothetical protein J2787_001563 [Chryseobacterium rhizosphaerae]|uniref:Uncharacterized protein n=1 Tax=Chryseobacterium rhizosphaerae TaxID=395937 RepID=A0AAE3Y9S7_9FLAO|nr:hypothetical protein [Chryseobacterium rhizosphaerae]